MANGRFLLCILGLMISKLGSVSAEEPDAVPPEGAAEQAPPTQEQEPPRSEKPDAEKPPSAAFPDLSPPRASSEPTQAPEPAATSTPRALAAPPMRSATPTPTPAHVPSPTRGESPRGVAEPQSESAARADSPTEPRAIQIGPLVGVGLPNLLSFGATSKLTRFVGLGFNVGLIPEVTLSLYGEAALEYREYSAYGRLYPFGGAFFLGAGIGFATVEGTLTRTFDVSKYQPLVPGLPASIEVVSDASASAMVLSPQIGWFHTFAGGFSLGFDAGAQVPVAKSRIEFATRVPAGVPQEVVEQHVIPNDKRVRETIESVAQTPLPTINLRLGWLF